MTPEEQRIAIAEVCGWTKVPMTATLWQHEAFPGQLFEPGELPDYLADLNAMHEAEKVLTRGQRIRFVSELCGIVGVKWRPTSHFDSIHATAAQRAEAFCRTLFPNRFNPPTNV